MSSETFGSQRSAAHPILRMLAAFPVACFTCALATDIAYTQTANIMWADFSAWLLAGGLAMGVLAAIVGAIDGLANRRKRGARRSWPVLVGGLVVLIIASFDNLVHSRDAWTSVMPTGVLLSAVLVVATLITVWVGSARSGLPEPAVQYSGVRR